MARYLAVATDIGDRVSAWDITNPASPSFLSQVTSLNDLQCVAVNGDGMRLFTISEVNENAHVIDCSNPASMSFIDSQSVLSNGDEPRFIVPHPNGTHVLFSSRNDDNLLSLVESGGVLSVADVLGGIDGPQDIAIHPNGTHAYVVSFDDGAIAVVDISNPASLSLVTTVNLVGVNQATGPVLIGDVLYVTDQTNNLLLAIDVSTPAAPNATPLDTLSTTSSATVGGRSPSGHLLYLERSGDLLVVDPTVSSMSILSTTSITNFGGRQPLAVSIDGTVCCARGSSDAVALYDCETNPASPNLLATISDGTILNNVNGIFAWNDEAEDEYGDEYEEVIPARRVTQFGIEVLSKVTPNRRVTQFGVESLSVGPATGGFTHMVPEFALLGELGMNVTQAAQETAAHETAPEVIVTQAEFDAAVEQSLPEVMVTHLLTDLILQQCPPLTAQPILQSVDFNEYLEDAWEILVSGSQPPAGIEVRYQLYDASDPSTVLMDSGWISWESEPYSFRPVDAFTCYAVRYGYRDQCPAQAWVFTIVRRFPERELVDDLIISMLQLHTQVRSPRVTKDNTVPQTWRLDFPRGGASGSE